MRVSFDIETDSLNPSVIWCLVLEDLDTGKQYSFIRPDLNQDKFRKFAKQVTLWVGQNVIRFDVPVIERLIGPDIVPRHLVIDTLILSHLDNHEREGGHSLEAWGERLGHCKIDFSDFSKFTFEMLAYCKGDVAVTAKLFKYLSSRLNSKEFTRAVQIEHETEFHLQDMQTNGFSFDTTTAKEIQEEIRSRLMELDDAVLRAFPPKTLHTEVVVAKVTKTGEVFKAIQNKYGPGVAPETEFCPLVVEHFNAGSPKQVVERLNEAGWSPVEKTKGYTDTEKIRPRTKEESAERKERLKHFKKYGWKVNETNLATLPEDAPEGAKAIVERMLHASRERTLTEWINCCHTETLIKLRSTEESIGPSAGEKTQTDGERKTESTLAVEKREVLSLIDDPILRLNTDSLSSNLNQWLLNNAAYAKYVKEKNNCVSITVTPQARLEGFSADLVIRSLVGTKIEQVELKSTSKIHGTVSGLGTWTQRATHRYPNTANIAAEKSLKYTSEKLQELAKQYGRRMRSLWRASEGRLLVGTDAEGIQLRIFGHYLGDQGYIDAIVNGDKSKGTDVHSYNQRIIGDLCRSRDNAKTFIYALLLGAGVGKIAQILNCTFDEAERIRDNFIQSIPGLRELKENVIPRDAKRGFFYGVDGRKVWCDSEHLMLAGYLQNGESLIMKYAMHRWITQLRGMGIPFWLVNWIHDEWQTETLADQQVAEEVGRIQCEAITWAGNELGLVCPMAGSTSVGLNWYATH